ncbi:L-aspartate oxidase [Calderihabitans maritimus]|uniref:L-aspartate oxidase n=1 Tax=Calderihabitans maritimus TaxID=1246530 RepID=A0A1Z5HXM7_9FIRM|nr:L-aspartate oxidase [Calderihabitans maritimus]GAW94091.1 hypothetical protein KKC1_32070 [Calderihabitans maritimus]
MNLKSRLDFSLDVTVTEASDFIVVGSGIAGLYTALKAAEHGRVLLLTKEGLDTSATYYAQGGIAAALAEEDDPELHLEDTLAAGAGLCRREAVEILVREGPRRVRELLDMGVPFDRDAEGNLLLAREGAHRCRRILRAGGDATGKAIQTTLSCMVKRHPDIRCMERVFVADLLTSGDTCHGVLALQEGRETWLAFPGKATILATGGLGQVYAFTTNPAVATGDGVAMACRAGAEVADMEFVQFHPTALFHPRQPGFLISEAVRGEGGRLINHRGERFMPRYHPQAELAPRDIVSRAIFSEMRRHGTDCVYLDLTHLPGRFLKDRFPTIYATLAACGVDMAAEPVPVAPAAHYSMGGIKTNLHGETSIRGLYAVGEVACNGVHGANRLASNSLLDALVFGYRAAAAAAAYVQCHPGIPRELYRPGKLNPRARSEEPLEIEGTRRRLRELMQREAGVIRHREGLARAKKEIGQMLDNLSFPFRDRQSLELLNMLTVAHLILSAAEQRKESRGSHYRLD